MKKVTIYGIKTFISFKVNKIVISGKDIIMFNPDVFEYEREYIQALKFGIFNEYTQEGYLEAIDYLKSINYDNDLLMKIEIVIAIKRNHYHNPSLLFAIF